MVLVWIAAKEQQEQREAQAQRVSGEGEGEGNKVQREEMRKELMGDK